MIKIDDKRILKDFNNKTFSGFNKPKVLKELMINLDKSLVEHSCNWCCELICAGHFLDIWNTIILFYTKYIHLGNPKLIIYISRSLSYFKSIVRNDNSGGELELRNNLEIRKMFAELICYLCFSRRQPSFRFVQIEEGDMNITNITHKFIAPDTTFGSDNIHIDDQKELFVAINELVYNLQYKNIMNSCFWVEWLIEFENTCVKKKCNCSCARRYMNHVDPKFQREVTWLIWEILLKQIESVESSCRSCLKQVCSSAFELFAVKYSRSVLKKRRGLLYFVVQLICETNLDLTKEILDGKNVEETKAIVKNIDLLFMDIKKKEVVALENSNSVIEDVSYQQNESNKQVKNSIEKLNMLNGL